MKLKYLPFDRVNQDFIHKPEDRLDNYKLLLIFSFLMYWRNFYHLIYSFSHSSSKMFISLLSSA